MSELILNTALAPELLTGLSGGAPATPLPAGRTPADGDTPANPFAALLSGFLQGTQPAAQAAGAPLSPDLGRPDLSRPDLNPVPALDERPDSTVDPLTLLGLPGSATPLTAVTGTSTDDGSSAGRTWPVTGNTLPATPALAGAPGSELPAADADAIPLDPTAGPAEARPRISLADLALSRPIEAAPGSAAAADAPTVAPAALTLADRALQPRGGRTSQPAGTSQPLPLLSVTQSLGQSVATAPATMGAEELAVRLNSTDLLRGISNPGAGSESVAGQFAAFAASNDSGGLSATAVPLNLSGGSDTPNAGLLSRLGNTTLPALQPLAGNQSFAGGLADRLLTLGGPGAHTARLKLHPEHLGELDVEIQIDDGAAQVWFGTTTSQAREAIEASLPRLKELFADQGLALTRTQVDGGQPGSQNSDQQRRMAAGRPVDADVPWRMPARAGSSPLAGLVQAIRPSTRLVDAWA